MACPNSITELFSTLCEQNIPETKRVNFIQPRVNKQQVNSRLKKKLYNTLFTFLKAKNKQQISQPKEDTVNPIHDVQTQIWWYILRLRRRRKFDEANRLENLFNTLSQITKDDPTGIDIYPVLQFILKLKDTGSTPCTDVVGHTDTQLPVIPKRDYVPLLPAGALCYGDTNMVQPSRFHYMHYPRCLFEGQPLEIENTVNNVCDMLPGHGLSGNGFFSVGGCLGDQHEKTTTESLFGGLVQGRVTSLDVKLELPELPDLDSDSRMMETRIPKSFSSFSMDLNDEGFKSQEESMASTTPDTDDNSPGESSFDSAFQADYDTSIYDDCLTDEISQHYTWETIGLGPGARMKPFLMEAGTQAFDHWNQSVLSSLQTAFPSVHVTPRVEVTQRSLVKDVLNLLIAVPSMNFMLDLTDQCFSLRDGIYVTGMSCDALGELLQDFLTLGMYYYRLDLFSTTPVLNSFYTTGLTYHAFTGAVETVLQYYRAAVLSISDDKTLTQLRCMCHNLMIEIRYLACLCRCNNPVTEETKQQFPTGVSLLSYIYEETLEASYSDHYPLMLSLLRNTCTPYLVFVQNWVYHGVYRDNYGEFMVQVHDDYLQFKDKHYWSHGYTLTSGDVKESVPLFLTELANDIFICGKTINLLKKCNRNHFMCDVDDSDIPRIALTFSETELSALSDQCRHYVNKMQQLARENSLSRQERVDAVERAKQEVISKARQVAAKELQGVYDKRNKIKKSVDAKKKTQLDFLKSQMETDLRRRAINREEASKEDRELMDKMLKKTGAMSEHDLELEKQAKAEVEEYYSQLSAEAELREQKALWKIRRTKLAMARSESLQQQERQWAQDMETAKSDPESVRVTTPIIATPALTQGLPRWAERDGPTLQVMEEEEGPSESGLAGDEEKNLPKWAMKGLKKYGMAPTMTKSPSPRAGGSDSIPAGKQTKSRRSLNSSFTVNEETEEEPIKQSVQTFGHMHATTESLNSDPAIEKTQVRMMSDRHATLETTEDEESRPHIKTVSNKNITQQSEGETEARPHLKTIDNQHANKETEESEYDKVPKLKHGDKHATTETESAEWIIKAQSEFGHSSETTTQQVQQMPKMKTYADRYATKETDFSTDFGIKPRIRISKTRATHIESEEKMDVKSQIKMSGKMSATKESKYVDHDEKRLQMFKERNVYGNMADSSVQKLLYNGEFRATQKDAETGQNADTRVVPSNDKLVWLDSQVVPYMDDFKFLDDPPAVHLLSNIPPAVLYGSYGNSNRNHDDIEGYKYLPLASVIKDSITGPLKAQISLVNESIVTYFMGDLQIEEHFKALRRYLCMGNGDFSQILCDLLMDKLGTNPRPQDLVNPMFLNNCLNKAIRLSINADDKYADNLTFLHKYLPKTMEQTSPDVLDCIQLHYEVKWPLNIVITKNSLHKYSQVFSFMLNLKRVVWVLKDVWHRLKRDGIVHKVDRCLQFRQLHLYRQEMQHFVKVIQEYIAHQVVEVTWLELKVALSKDVHNLDDLHAAHNRYLDSALFRCLLTKNASSLMKIIQDIFRLILKYHRQLLTGSWSVNKAGVMTHRNYLLMCDTYKVFLEHSGFLFKVVSKLAVRGYEPHLHDLLLRLNFNNYYEK